MDANYLAHAYGVCERTAPGLFEEPFNLLSSLGFFAVAIALYRFYSRECAGMKDKWVWDVYALKFLVVMIGLGSVSFHSFPSVVTELMDMIPIVIFILVFFFSVLFRIGKTNLFQASVCFMAFAGSTHMLLSMFPNALNDSIGYLSSMAALIMVAIYLNSKRRPSAHAFLTASLVGVVSLFFRGVDNAVCEEFQIGTHFLWHSCNAWLLWILVRQVIRNVNREARIARDLEKSHTQGHPYF